jgi:hypothetical protein
LEEQKNKGFVDSIIKLNQFSEMLKVEPISKSEKLNRVFVVCQNN